MGYCEADYCVDDYAAGPAAFLDIDVLGTQWRAYVASLEALGFQYRGTIAGVGAFGAQYKGYIDRTTGLGTQFLSIGKKALGLQFRSLIYNTDRIRFLTEFDSRGATGSNWTVTSTATGDFSSENMNSDIVELKWRSNNDVIVTLDCDTQVTQGVFVDTLAILNHNISAGGTLVIYGSNDPTFSSIGITITPTYTQNNIFWVNPEPPRQQYRYWRFSITDSTNPDGYIEIGSIVFGSARIFNSLENFNGRVGFERRVYTDKVSTEGYTNVENIRNRSNVLTLGFEDLAADGANFETLKEIFETYQTTHKILVIPYPQTPTRFAVFAKLEELPTEQHRQDGVALVDFDITFDESL